MKKSLIATALLAFAMAASAAPAESVSTPTVFAASTDPNISSACLYCPANGPRFSSPRKWVNANKMDSQLELNGGGSTCQKDRQTVAMVVGPQTGGFVGRVYIPRAGVVPESNKCIAT